MMAKMIEVITVEATAPGTGASWAAVSGNSLTVKESKKKVWLGPVWQKRQAAGFFRLVSPLLHDTSNGIRMQAPIGNSVTLWSELQPLESQDSLLADGTGSATAGDIEQAGMLFCYEDASGVDAYLINDAELKRRGEMIYSFPNTLATGTAGGYSGAEAINAEVDQLKANRDYAIIGYDLTVECATVRFVGPDWGNVGIGGPGPVGGTSGAMETREWFRHVSNLMGMPAIPVFNASNKSLVQVSAAQDENGGDPVITTICVLLSGRRK